ncbi:hypothetical protein ACRALDRAFT_2020085 [Sodiomyces alcalophilus JCM 7366]|uniref:uncharacterized protein n=1 Tax=Sodiomyces alcalophilus JCM 7366 TaxID=591952 RepID=UPI0039B5F700
MLSSPASMINRVRHFDHPSPDATELDLSVASPRLGAPTPAYHFSGFASDEMIDISTTRTKYVYVCHVLTQYATHSSCHLVMRETLEMSSVNPRGNSSNLTQRTLVQLSQVVNVGDITAILPFA